MAKSRRRISLILPRSRSLERDTWPGPTPETKKEKGRLVARAVSSAVINVTPPLGFSFASERMYVCVCVPTQNV